MKKTILFSVLALLCLFFRAKGQEVNKPSKTILYGKVMDDLGQTLPGAIVRLQGNQVVTSTDNQGSFSLTNIPGAGNLVITFIGFKPVTVAYDLSKQDNIRVTLLKSTGSFEEVVVIGYGQTTRRLNTGSVSSVNSATLEKQPITNVLSALSGRASGVVVQTGNGLPGGAINIQIRGKGSISAGTNPLYIVDGIPFAPDVIPANNTLAIGAINGAVSPLNSLNPDDIESISILKDADATAIYGSRGSNGVVLITTKKGQAGKTQVNINVSSGTIRSARLPKLLDLQQYLSIRREAFRNDGITPSADPNDPGYAPDLMLWDTTRSTNWAKYFLGKTAHFTDVQGSISGGNQNTNFVMGGNYHREGTVLPGEDRYLRSGVHLSLQHYSEDKKFFTQFSASYNGDNNRLTNAISSFPYDVLLPPNFPLKDAAGNINYTLGINPLSDVSAISKTKTDNIILNSLLRYTVAKGLNLKTSVGYNRIGIRQVMTYPTDAQYQGSPNLSNFGNTSNENIIVEPQIDYSKTFGQSTINLLAGGTYQSTLKESEQIEARNFTSDELLENLASATTHTLFNSRIQYRYVSVFGRANYNYGDKYLINASIRRDGSSRFGPGNEFGTFWAIGAAWLFSNEGWAKDNLGFLSYGKLRSSYGKTGNDQISDYQYLSAYQNSGYVYQGTAGIEPARLYNANFHWESTNKLELAVELGLLKDRVMLNVNYYRARTTDQLVDYAVPTLTGFSAYQANLPAVVENSGWEFELSTKNIRNSNFSWTTNFNITVPRNRLLSFKDLNTSSYANRLVIGEPITRLYGYQFTGIGDTGSPLYQTLSGTPSANPDPSADQFHLLAAGFPKFYGGIGNTVTIKNWSLDVFGQFARQFTQGGQIYTPGIYFNNFANALNRWQKPGDQTIVPKASTSYAYYTTYNQSSANIFNTSYFRVKNIALSYTFPGNWLNRKHIKNLRVYLQAQNLFTFSDKNVPVYDPETGGGTSIPPMKTLVAGIQLTL